MDFKKLAKKNIPYLSAIVIFYLLAILYCSPAIEGKVIQQSDITMARGSQKEVADFNKETGEYSLWTNSMFGGMPTYLVGIPGEPIYNVYYHIGNTVRKLLPMHSADFIFIYLISFWILLLVLRVDPWMSIVGAIAFAFSSYNFIIIEVGHINKAYCISFLPAVLGGFWLIFKQKHLKGAILFIISLGLSLTFYHYQMSYYLMLALAVFYVVHLIFAIREKQINKFLVSTAIVLGCAILATVPTSVRLITTYNYSKETIRGPSELTSNQNSTKKGLDRDYALGWSYGKAETFTFLIPNFYGGVSTQDFTSDSKVYEKLIDNRVKKSEAKQVVKTVPTTVYWGDQPSTSGPVYFGAIVCFLFVLGILLVDLKTRMWVLIAIILTVLLSWGKNFIGLSNFFLDYFPLYNKFRAVSSILIVPSILFPLVAFLGLKELTSGKVDKKKFYKNLKISFGITAGFCLFFLIFGKSLFNFTSPHDENLPKYGFPDWFIDSIKEERLSLFRADAIRSFLFISVALALLVSWFLKKMNSTVFTLLLGVLILMDMWTINKRYLNNEKFKPRSEIVTQTPTEADRVILNDSTSTFRVFNLAYNPFNEAITSYFHHSIGGYHAAKLRRYQELIEHHIAKQNQDVLNMLNTKYYIISDKEKNRLIPQLNRNALGNAWFVKKMNIVDNADEELKMLGNFNPAETAIIDKRFTESNPLINNYKADSITGTITLEEYKPNHLSYVSKSNQEQFAVFSEIYYNPKGDGWRVFINGEPADHYRVNYVLRGMFIPKGENRVEFVFEPKSFSLLKSIELISSILALLIIFGLLFINYRNKNRLKTAC